MGVTVGTPISPSTIDKKLKPIKSVNNAVPDENGNLEIEIPEGANGKTPYIKDGNWWIGDTDTGVKAEGEYGVGISKVEKTATNGNIDTYTITYTNGNTSTFTVTNGADGFSPTVSVEAINGGHRVIITDKNGEKKVNILNGADGRGIASISKLSTNGFVDTYQITFTDETTATFTVTNGKAGTSVTVTNVSESTADGGSNVVTFSDGKTLTVKNGKNGAEGKTPYIKNKTWWIGDTDTGIKAEGTNGKDGISATHSWNGTTLTITSASGTSSANLKGDKGNTPIKGVDYFTLADQEAIVQQVITALGTPVFGRVDEDNNIILTGVLAEGEYVLKYEDAEGNVTTIGTISTIVTDGEIPMTINVGKIDTSTGKITTDEKYTYSQLIPIESGKKYILTATNCTVSAKVCYYDANQNYLSVCSDDKAFKAGETSALGSNSAELPMLDGASYFRIRFYNNYYGSGYAESIAINIAGTKLTWNLA